MRPLILWLPVILACSNNPEPRPKPQVQNEFESFERAFATESASIAKRQREAGREIPGEVSSTSYRAVFIGPSGVFVDRKLVATLAELDTKRAAIVVAVTENAALMPTVGLAPTVTFDLGSEPAEVATSALRLFTGRRTIFYRRLHDANVPDRAHEVICDANVHVQPTADMEAVKLSVLLAPEQILVGLSRIDEYQEIPHTGGQPDLATLETALKAHKATAFFTNRTDLELAAGGRTSGDVIGALEIACRAGFLDIAVLELGQLSAGPRK